MSKLKTQIMRKNIFIVIAVGFVSSLLGAGVAAYAIGQASNTTVEYVNQDFTTPGNGLCSMYLYKYDYVYHY